MSVVSAHVSVCPNHQNLRSTPLETRFPIAAFGVCGYEYNLCETSEEEFAAVFHGKNRDRRGLRLVPLCSAHASCHMRNLPAVGGLLDKAGAFDGIFPIAAADLIDGRI